MLACHPRKIDSTTQKTYRYKYSEKLRGPTIFTKPPFASGLNVVYKVNCNDCDASYVGENKRGVGVRILKEHKPDSYKPHKLIPFFKHIVATDHLFDFEESQVLGIEPHYYRRITSELVDIHAKTNPLNIQEDLDKMHSIYKP